MSNVITVSEADFEHEVLHPDVPVLVDYWAPWCGPRRRVERVIERIADERVGAHPKHTIEGALSLDAQTETAA